MNFWDAILVPFLGWIFGAIFSGFPWQVSDPCSLALKQSSQRMAMDRRWHLCTSIRPTKTAECLHRLPSCRLKLANTAHFKANPGLVSHLTSPIRFPCGSQQKIKLLRKARLDTKLDGFVHAQEPYAIDMEPYDKGNIRCALRVSARWCPDCCTVWLPA